jgi:hypothetical protein
MAMAIPIEGIMTDNFDNIGWTPLDKPTHTFAYAIKRKD